MPYANMPTRHDPWGTIDDHQLFRKTTRRPLSSYMYLIHSGYAKYVAAIPTQVGLMTGALLVLQEVNNGLTSGAIPLPDTVAGDDVAKGIVTLFFLVVSIKSRIFSLLDASRPNVRGENTAIAERRRPSWMPPPLTFPIV